MNLRDLINRNPTPAAWAEGDNIPWSDPDFSERMLKEHLTQDHDMASRTTPLIERQVTWIDETVLEGQPSFVLDLGCGPGLYANRLAQLGHRCKGIDYSPASINYARKTTQGTACTFVHGDLRTTPFGETEFDLAMLLFGETNIFSPQDIRHVLKKAADALKPGGKLLLEPHTYELVREIGESGTSWYTSEGGLFSEEPHLMLTENFWDEENNTATVRHFVWEADREEADREEADRPNVTRHAQSFQAYSNEDYVSLLKECGFERIQIWPNLGGVDKFTGQLLAITAVKA